MDNLTYQIPVKRAYGEIYAHNNVVPLTIPEGETTYTKIIPFTANGVSKRCTNDFVNGTITVAIAGTYNIGFTASSKVDVNQVAFRTVVFRNGVELNNIHAKRLIKLSSEESTVHIEGFATLAAGDVLDVRVRHDYAGSIELTTEYCNLNVTRMDR